MAVEGERSWKKREQRMRRCYDKEGVSAMEEIFFFYCMCTRESYFKKIYLKIIYVYYI